MARTKLHRKENGQWIAIGTGVFYIKEAGAWRETTKAEMDVLQTQIEITDAAEMPLIINAMPPDPASGEDDDYYVLLYPLDWDGPVWDPALPNS